ncbi:6148_t:CDS:2 [Entrophospora sp. SA101]|nr:13622_t:CDS:2 [Entrophospora sp. SA101]CAJ0913589.1 6148_t:CDS:2 [Entrophospora sp. SA101]
MLQTFRTRFRPLVDLIMLSLFVVSIVVSIIKICNEKSAIGISYGSTDKLIAPAFYFAYDKSFNISCVLTKYNDDASCNEYITQPVMPPNIHDSSRPLLGTFLPKGNLSLDGTGYDPWSEDLSGDPFVKTFDYMNLYYLSRRTYYSLMFSSKIRNKITQPALAKIGLESYYFPQYYIESRIQIIPLKNRPDYNLVVQIDIASFVIEEETEQRSNTVITTVGSLLGYYGIIAYFYKILFGSKLISIDSAREYMFLLAAFLYLTYSMFKRKIIGISSSGKSVFFI